MKNYFKTRLIPLVPLVLIVLLASFFRLYGLDWDQGHHLHPDERFLTMVVSAIKIPKSFSEYLNPKISPMSPYNNNFSFFVYGTFPLYLTKIIGGIFNKIDYWNIHFVGRILSAVFDIGVVLLLFKIGKKIFNEKVGLLSAFLYAIMVLPIQLSHFFAVDTFLTFFLVLSFYFLILLISSYPSSPSKKLRTLNFELLTSSAMGGAFGLALACKISALYFLPIIGLSFLSLFKLLCFSSGRTQNKVETRRKGFFFLIVCCFVFIFTSLFTFRFTQPTAFSSGNLLNWQPNSQFIKNLQELKSYNTVDSWFPPAIQWHSAKPIIFPLKNLVLWGMGLPLGIISLVALIYSLISLIRLKSLKSLIANYQLLITLLIVFWVLGLFIYQGLQFCKTIRYFLPIYPFLAVLSANFLIKIDEYLFKKISRPLFLITNCLLLIAVFIYPISFLSIYSRPITRVTASKWIYENIPNGSTVTYEEWDDGLPLGLPDYPPANFKTESLMMYDFDTPEKWQKLNEKLAKVDYIFLTSNRAYGSIMKLPEKYPQTTAYYQSLLNGTGKFKKAAEFTSYPCFPPFGKPLFCFNDDNADESFTVYDHPGVFIFQKDKKEDTPKGF